MSSSPTAPTSTTASSGNCRSRQVEILACGALSGHVREIVARRGWPVAVRSLPAVLHNRPQEITLLAERAVVSALRAGRTAALAYADCGTYGALDELCGHYRRLVWLAQEPSPALTAKAERVAAMFGLPLTRIDTGVSRLERELSRLVEEDLEAP